MSFKSASFVLAALLLVAIAPAQAAPIVYVANLSGAIEAPPNASPATGYTIVTIDSVAHSMSVTVSYSGLIGGATASHIHCCTAVAGAGTIMVATETPSFEALIVGLHAQTFTEVFDMTLADSYNPAFIAAHGGTTASAEAALFAGIEDGKAYLNVHSTFAPGGEIRGFLEVPEPASLALIGLPLLALWRRARRPVAT